MPLHSPGMNPLVIAVCPMTAHRFVGGNVGGILKNRHLESKKANPKIGLSA